MGGENFPDVQGDCSSLLTRAIHIGGVANVYVRGSKTQTSLRRVIPQPGYGGALSFLSIKAAIKACNIILIGGVPVK